MDYVGHINIAGKLAQISPAGKWWAAVPKNQWDLEDEAMVESIKENWDEPYGDRRQEFVLIGSNINKDKINKQIESCLLTNEELQQGPDIWKDYTDPIHAWELIETEEEGEVFS